MALVKPVIFQIAGFQDSGKTTLSLKLIEQLSQSGLKVATVKHHGHGGKPDVNGQKDSGRHITAGASASLVEGGGRLLLQAEDGEWTIKEKIELLSSLDPDVILIEGHKHESFPKALLLRNEEDLCLLDELQAIKVVLYHDSRLEKLFKELPMPAFHIGDDRGEHLILRLVKEQANR
ncbi:molybdopterin-guanine dinucleotide biosynthesis protein B [Bacillus sp. REN3]|uniref:molybdopterin-guanine dinucleotide biosynthesis protein B n=1 Tax=Bacillus sp. REN3 TaxID=2802440 RepID=UPI001AEE7437|nr:molybdopterin-guanine dinucleotide biosynthesis protein B [Bacillus sp. REN3]